MMTGIQDLILVDKTGGRTTRDEEGKGEKERDSRLKMQRHGDETRNDPEVFIFSSKKQRVEDFECLQCSNPEWVGLFFGDFPNGASTHLHDVDFLVGILSEGRELAEFFAIRTAESFS